MAKTIKINPDAFGEAMRRARQAARMTKAEAGRAIGIPQQQIWAIEEGRRLPTIKTLERLIGAYGYTLNPSVEEVIMELEEYTWSEAQRVSRVKYSKQITTTYTYLDCCKIINFKPELIKCKK